MSYGEFLSRLFTTVWHVFTDLEIPVIGLTFAQFYVGIWVIVLGIFIIHSFLGFGSHIASGIGYRMRRGKKYAKRNKSEKVDSTSQEWSSF